MRAQAAETPGAVTLLHPLRLRYFSPQELLRLFCFENRGDGGKGVFQWPEGVSRKSQYRLIGNSVNVRVVRELIDFLFE